MDFCLGVGEQDLLKLVDIDFIDLIEHYLLQLQVNLVEDEARKQLVDLEENLEHDEHLSVSKVLNIYSYVPLEGSVPFFGTRMSLHEGLEDVD